VIDLGRGREQLWNLNVSENLELNKKMFGYGSGIHTESIMTKLEAENIYCATVPVHILLILCYAYAQYM
jgi:hypothetical protein